MGAKRRAINIIKALLMWGVSLLIFIPLALMLINSVKTSGEADLMNFAWPSELLFSNYATVIESAKLGWSLLSSIIIATGTVVLALFGASTASFVMSRRKKERGFRAAYIYFLVGLVAPLNMVPAVFVLKYLHLTNSYFGVIFLFTALVLPFSVFLYYGFIGTVPRELDEAAVIDGCTGFRLFFKVVFPLMKPVTVTVVILNFMNSWNDFILPFYVINDSKKLPMTTSVYNFFGAHMRDWNLVCANMVMIIAPIIIVYLLGQKYIISGMTSGAVKG